MDFTAKYLTSFTAEVTNVEGLNLAIPVKALSYANACAIVEEQAYMHPNFRGNIFEIRVYRNDSETVKAHKENIEKNKSTTKNKKTK